MTTKNKRRSNEETEARLAQARRYFQQHHAGVEPEAAFATRVSARLDSRQADLLGRFALRLLPGALALTAVLAGFVVQLPQVAPDGTDAVVALSTADDDVLDWLLEEPEAVP